MSRRKKIATLIVVFLTMVLSALWSSANRKNKLKEKAVYFNVIFHKNSQDNYPTQVLSWLHSGRSRSLMITKMETIEGAIIEYVGGSEILNLMDARCGWGASSLKQTKNLMSQGGFVVRQKDGNLVGFCDLNKEFIVVPALNQ
jgi:hypothetical protein